MKNTATRTHASEAWTTALVRFDADLERRGAAERTRRAYGADIGELATWAAAQGLEPQKLTYRLLRGYAARLSDRGAAPRTMARKLASARAFFRSMVEHGDMTANPADLLPAPKTPQAPPTIKPQDVAALLDRMPATTPLEQRDRALFELAHACKLRADELVSLDADAVDFAAEEIRLATRAVPAGEQALAAVNVYLERGRPTLAADDPALFLSKSGRRLSTSDVRRRVRSWARRAASQGSPVAIHEMLGHASISTTQVYTRVESARLRAAYLRSHPRA
ncbi:MAG TPA: tyrosine-type recombinase/integrase [Solirubrobacteraceae bacterium]|nr:tyrosine-type recombinase/integrase [Solirubrobacteraceae bacterium]